MKSQSYIEASREIEPIKQQQEAAQLKKWNKCRKWDGCEKRKTQIWQQKNEAYLNIRHIYGFITFQMGIKPIHFHFFNIIRLSVYHE